MEEFLTEIEIDKIEAFSADDVMFEAVKKVILAGVYTNGVITKGKPHNPAKNFALALANDSSMDNEQLGARLRAAQLAVSLLQDAVAELKRIKREKVSVETPYNDAI